MQKLSDIMHGIITIGENGFLREAAIKMVENHRGSIIITSSKNKTVGILTERDFLRLAATGVNLSTTMVRDHYTKNIITADENTSVDDAVGIMIHKGIRRLPVTRNGKIIGSISIRSILKNMRYSMAERFFSESANRPELYSETNERAYR